MTTITDVFVKDSDFDAMKCETVMPILFGTSGLCIILVFAVIFHKIKSAMERADKLNQTIAAHFSTNLAEVRNQTMKKALFFLYILVGVSLYSLIDSICIYVFYTDLCMPLRLPI